jgi:hypothetical protein
LWPAPVMATGVAAGSMSAAGGAVVEAVLAP